MDANKRIAIEDAVRFHGHLGPYLILGILAGAVGLKKLKCKKYFGVKVRVWGANKKPESCLIDGLQLSTGATYGKGNIQKLNGPIIRIEFSSCSSRDKILLALNGALKRKLEKAKTHEDSEKLAKQLYKTSGYNLFDQKKIS